MRKSPNSDEVQADTTFTRLLAAARTGNREALGELFSQFRNYLLAVAERELPPELYAKGSGNDLIQDAFLEAQVILSGFTGTRPDEFRAWLRAVLLCKLHDFRNRYLRAQSRQVYRERSLDDTNFQGPVAHAVPDPASTPSASVAREEESRALIRALARLPDSYQQVIRWRTWEGLSFGEIGQRLGKTEDAARMLWGRAIERLHRELQGPSP